MAQKRRCTRWHFCLNCEVCLPSEVQPFARDRKTRELDLAGRRSNKPLPFDGFAARPPSSCIAFMPALGDPAEVPSRSVCTDGSRWSTSFALLSLLFNYRRKTLVNGCALICGGSACSLSFLGRCHAQVAEINCALTRANWLFLDHATSRLCFAQRTETPLLISTQHVSLWRLNDTQRW